MALAVFGRGRRMWYQESWLVQHVYMLLACGALVHVNSMTVTLQADEKLEVTCEAGAGEVVITPSASVLGSYSHWAVSTDAAPCARVPRRIYKKNGTTVDAAIATLLCMGVVLPHSMGIGGGFIATIYSRATKTAQVLIAREKAPACATEDMFVNKSTPQKIWGGLPVGVPGELRGYKELHERLNGTLNWTQLFDDAIKLARQGFAVGPHLAQALQMGSRIPSQNFTDNLRKAFSNNETGEFLAEGELLIQEDLANTLESIARNGVEHFYNSTLTQEIVNTINNSSGVMSVEDFANYTVEWVDPVNASFRDGHTLFSVPPPGSGPVLTYILGIMDQFREYEGARLKDDALTLHRFTEACKFAYAKRASLGDPSFVNCTELARSMTSTNFAKRAKAKINDSCTFADPGYYGFVNEYQKLDNGTAHATFWGPDGYVIAISSSINYYFGSLLRTNSGVLLNNQMDDFSTPGQRNIYKVPPSPSNFIKSGKRPMSSMAPAIVVDKCGDVKLAIGGTGGSRITSGVALATMRTLWQGNTIKEAIDFPRLHHQLFPNQLDVEPFFPRTYVKELERRGHKVNYHHGRFSVIMGVRESGGRLYANADFRKGGSVDGQ
uniref:Gamma-glutamyltransferase n=1 Tax=Amblyomma maculatum TaxID=34609 RepID=G3MPR7_AMBMU